MILSGKVQPYSSLCFSCPWTARNQSGTGINPEKCGTCTWSSQCSGVPTEDDFLGFGQERIDKLGNVILSHDFKVTKIIFNSINFWPLSKYLSDIWFHNAEQCIKKIEAITLLDSISNTFESIYFMATQIYICCFLLQMYFFFSQRTFEKSLHTVMLRGRFWLLGKAHYLDKQLENLQNCIFESEIYSF